MGKPDIVYECREAETGYRISPNPDAAPGVGYQHGAILMHDGDGGGEWVKGSQFFIAPESLEAVGLALLEAASDFKKGEA